MDLKIKVRLIDNKTIIDKQCLVYDKIIINNTDHYLYRNPMTKNIEYIECYKIIDINKYINKKV